MESFNKMGKAILPTIAVFVLMAASWTAYNATRFMDNPALYLYSANVFGTVYAGIVFFSPTIVYFWACKRGASPGARTMAALVNPFLWATKESIRISAAFGFFECLYYYLNPMNMIFACFVAVQIGLAAQICQLRGPGHQTLHPKALIAAVAGLGGIAIILAMGCGEALFWSYMAGFRTIFGGGV